MKKLLKNGMVYTPEGFKRMDLAVENDSIRAIGVSVSDFHFDEEIDCDGFHIIPGFVDVHVHLREPGFSYKEDIASGTAAAARAGYTAVCSMPNLNPPPDTPEHLEQELRPIRETAKIHVYPYACITVGQTGRGELTDMKALADCGALGFSDDGKGVQDGSRMREAMTAAHQIGKPIVAHCEDESLLTGGWIHDGEYARLHGHKGISSESEWKQIERDLLLAEQTGCQYHVCHISTKESVELIRSAKKRGVSVTCETGPHYLTMCDMDLQEDGRFKMNPPIRSAADRDALVAGLLDGTVDVVATDHAPHNAEEKSRGLQKSAMGVVGLETAFPVLYTKLVLPGILTLEQLLDKMCIRPREIFHLPGGQLEPGQPADLAVLDLNSRYPVDPARFVSKGKASPFTGWEVQGENLLTLCGGKEVYRNRDRI